MSIQAIKGTKDILGLEVEKYEEIIETGKKVFSSFDFKRIITPIFEKTELFQRGIGEGTDIVEKEMYTFLDKGNRKITLRPEGTASVVRAYIENKIYAEENISKYYYHGPMFRYEKPQAGRQREFNQIGAEVFGISNPLLDAELILMAFNFLKELGINEIELQVNSLGNKESRLKYKENLLEFLSKRIDNLCEDCKNRYVKNPLRVLDCKNQDCQSQYENAPKLSDSFDEESKNHFEALKKYLKEFDIPFTVNEKLVRGLDYYSHTVFEVIDRSNKLGAQSTILAGGRYDGLIEQIGEQKIPGIGFAAGIERLMLLLDENKEEKIKVFVVCFDEKDKGFIVNLINQLRKEGIKTIIEYENKSMKAQMKRASKLSASHVILIGEEEIQEGKYQLKDFNTGEQNKYTIEEIISKLKK